MNVLKYYYLVWYLIRQKHGALPNVTLFWPRYLFIQSILYEGNLCIIVLKSVNIYCLLYGSMKYVIVE